MKQINVRGNTIKFQELNEDKEEVVLLVHGHPFNHSMWKYQYEVLKEYRLIVPDLIGYGASDYNFGKIFIEVQALDLAILLDELRINRVHLIGLSMGGQIIVEFHRLFPQKVRSLIICASTPNAENNVSYHQRILLAESIQKTGMINYTQRNIHKYINLEYNDVHSEAYRHLYQMMITTKIKGAVASHLGRAERRDNLNHLKNVSIPALVVAGEKDHFFKAQHLKIVADKIPNASFVEIQHSGHLPNMEFPEIFNEIISAFYREIK